MYQSCWRQAKLVVVSIAPDISVLLFGRVNLRTRSHLCVWLEQSTGKHIGGIFIDITQTPVWKYADSDQKFSWIGFWAIT